jgi:hypothetical protein
MASRQVARLTKTPQAGARTRVLQSLGEELAIANFLVKRVSKLNKGT